MTNIMRLQKKRKKDDLQKHKFVYSTLITLFITTD